MRTLDFTPLYRATIGFDQIADIMDRVLASDTGQSSYPPYNIEKTSDDGYRLSIAVAGFAEKDISVEVKENVLYISAKREGETDTTSYLHRGIANRGFRRGFTLADYIKVGEAFYENGMLHIDLIREMPEALKPRKIAIQSGKALQIAAKAKAVP